ncbi:MAG TPA: hypothetical protein V6D05_13565 [Stenomitos sp.]
MLTQEANRPRFARSSVSLREMIRIYDACIQVREISKEQLDLSDEMALIATNAEIAAAKSTLNKEAFIVLANETGKIALQMSAHVASILQDSDRLAQDALVGVQRTRRLKHFHEGRRLVQDAENAQAVGEVIGNLEGVLSDIYANILGRLDQIEQGRQAISKQTVKVARIITYFRIEASRDDLYGAYFRNIGDDLDSLCQTAHTVSDQMGAVLAAAQHP